jgi:hypothetical protein
MKFLFDPAIFNYVIMGLYTLSAIRWFSAGKWADGLYWCGALWITAVVSFGYKR